MWKKLTDHPLFWHIVGGITLTILGWIMGLPKKLGRVVKSGWTKSRDDRLFRVIVTDRSLGICAAITFIILSGNIDHLTLSEKGFLTLAFIIAFSYWIYYPFKVRTVMEKDRRRVFVLISAFHKEQFFAVFLHHILNALRARNFNVEVKEPTAYYSPADQDRHFDEIMRRKQSYIGGLVVPIEPHNRRNEITRFAKDFGKPIVFIDDPPFLVDTDYPSGTCFVGSDNLLGGEQAARALIHALTNKKSGFSRILIICGYSQTQRQEGFRAYLRQLFPNAELVIEPNGKFSRDQARHIATNYLTQALNSQRFYDAVFCTNDEMALGVVEALQTLATENNESTRQTIVIGYDGIREAIKSIEDEGTPFKNTVVQNIPELAQRAVTLLDEMLANGDKPTSPKMTLLKTQLYRQFYDSLSAKAD